MSRLKTFIATVEIEFNCVDEAMVRDRVITVPFGDSDLGFRIVKIEEGALPEGTDECELHEYREFHDLGMSNYRLELRGEGDD